MEKVWEAQKGKRKMVLYVGPEEEGLCQSNKTVPETETEAKSQGRRALGFKGDFVFLCLLASVNFKIRFCQEAI